MEDVPCALCGDRETAVERRHGPWILVRCRPCGLVWLNPRPEPATIEADYDWFRHAPQQAGERRAGETPLRRLFRAARGRGVPRRKARQRAVVRRVARLVPGGRFLDVGCGRGEMVAALADAGYEAFGLDISDVAVAHAHRRGRPTVSKGRIQEAPFPDSHFDAILLMSYLEHEHHPAGALAKTRDLLRPGGHVLAKVPHYGSLNRRLMGASWSGYYFPQHLYYFTPRTLAALMRKAGLDVVRNGFRDHVPVSDVFWIAARRPSIDGSTV